jgi:hypothetical protein
MIKFFKKLLKFRGSLLFENFYEFSRFMRVRHVYLRLRMFETRVLRRIFGSKRNGVTGEWRKLHNEELSVLYCYQIYFG